MRGIDPVSSQCHCKGRESKSDRNFVQANFEIPQLANSAVGGEQEKGAGGESMARTRGDNCNGRLDDISKEISTF
jgi:hypothetical protein